MRVYTCLPITNLNRGAVGLAILALLCRCGVTSPTAMPLRVFFFRRQPCLLGPHDYLTVGYYCPEVFVARMVSRAG